MTHAVRLILSLSNDGAVRSDTLTLRQAQGEGLYFSSPSSIHPLAFGRMTISKIRPFKSVLASRPWSSLELKQSSA